MFLLAQQWRYIFYLINKVCLLDDKHVVVVGYSSMAKRSTASLVKYVRLLTEAGVLEKPAWLNAVQRCDAA
jgi:hypothetical protein